MRSTNQSLVPVLVCEWMRVGLFRISFCDKVLGRLFCPRDVRVYCTLNNGNAHYCTHVAMVAHGLPIGELYFASLRASPIHENLMRIHVGTLCGCHKATRVVE